MIEFLWTFLCVFFAIGSLFLVGLPIATLLSPKEDYNKEILWIIAPFLGLAIIVIFLQNLIYINLTLKQGTLIIWIITGLFWAWLLKSPRKIIISKIPILLLCIAFIIYLIQGVGLLILDVDTYVGRGWHDQINYTLTAQSLMDYPFHYELQNLNDQPSALKGITIAHIDRIGAMLYQGFLASTLFTEAKITFEPAILILSFLSVLAIYQLAQELSLSKKNSLFTAAIGGSLPSLAAIHLECFFSQALATPLLLFWPILLSRIFTSRCWQSVLVAAIFLAGITSIYTEFYLIFIGFLCLALLFNITIPAKTGIQEYSINIFKFRTSGVNKLLTFIFLLIAIIVIALALNPGYFTVFYDIINRSISANFLIGLYPWAGKLEGLSRLWLGDFAAKNSYTILYFITNLISIILISFVYIGFGLKALKQKQWIAMACFLLSLLPIGIFLIGHREYEYQFYKLLLTISPLFPLGIVLFFQQINRSISPLIFWITLLITSTSTIYMGYGSTDIKSQIALNRGGAFKMLTPEILEIQKKLSTPHKQNILINWQDDFFNGNFMNGWLNYFARYHKIWLTNPNVGDFNNVLETFIVKLDSLPKKFLLLTPTLDNQLITGTAVHKFWNNKHYSFFSIDGKNWALLYFAKTFKQSPLHILAGESGIVSLKMNMPTQTALIKINDHLLKKYRVNSTGEIIVQIPVKKGITVLDIQSIPHQEQKEIIPRAFFFKSTKL